MTNPSSPGPKPEPHPFSRSLFLTGTGTNVGKTHVAQLLLRALRAAGTDAVGMKPICCGDRDDALRLHEASGPGVELNDVNPVWLRTPAAPYTAALIENRPVDLALVRDRFEHLRATHRALIVEGVGGWRVPITQDYFASDLAADFALPIVVVVANHLGALNHALLTVEAIIARGLTCVGIILNHPCPPLQDIAETTNRSVLESLLTVPILAEIAYGQCGLLIPRT